MEAKQQSYFEELPEAANITAAKEALLKRFPGGARAFVRTYGCQQNEADSERLRGILEILGCTVADEATAADIIVFNTCAVRDSAERRVFGNVGALKGLKEKNGDLIIAVCGCMTQRPEARERLLKSYPYVDIVFGASMPHALPGLLQNRLNGGRRQFLSDEPGGIIEHTPVRREGSLKAWLPIMQGCNNFCTYCIVPYVRGRERSRRSEEILNEARELIALGCRDITLLGQNVNSYSGGGVKFPELLYAVNGLPGDFRIRFMTSHPRDCSEELIRAVAECQKACAHIHLPVQSGSDRILSAMNRHYTRADYLRLIETARKLIPGVTFTSDIIVGFPGETEEDFLDTLSLVKEVEYASLFTFIYSPRAGTPSAVLPDPFTEAEKKERFNRLLELQAKIGERVYRSYIGRRITVLAEGEGKRAGTLTGRSESGIIVEFKAPAECVGEFVDVDITGAKSWALVGNKNQ